MSTQARGYATAERRLQKLYENYIKILDDVSPAGNPGWQGELEVTQHWPPYQRRKRPPTWSITLYSAHLTRGAGKQQTWKGKTLEDCLTKAEKDQQRTIKDYVELHEELKRRK